jgi:hypothetical protein
MHHAQTSAREHPADDVITRAHAHVDRLRLKPG